MSSTFQLVLYTVNIVFLTTSLYSWVMKRFHIPLAYKDNFGELFPARQTLASMYLLQLTEIPYLFVMDKPEGLFYVNAIALLVFSSYLQILVKGYFFLEFSTPLKMFYYMHPVYICWIALMLPILGIIEFSPLYHTIMTIYILLLFMGYLYMLDRQRHYVMDQVRDIDENEYSNDSDFPVKVAKSVKWLPLLLCVLLLVTFLLNLYTAKLIRDIIFIVVNVWFAVYTMNPHRKAKKLPVTLKKMTEDAVEPQSKYRLSEKYCKETEEKIFNLILDKKLYLEEHFSMNDLTDILHINKNYISEVIARSEYRSFYKLINTIRIKHACELLKKDNAAKLEMVAISSGFSSGSAFSQVFKRLMVITPKEYISQIHAE